MNIQQTLKDSADKLKSRNIPSAHLDAEVLLLEALRKCGKNIEKSWLYINNDYALNKIEEKQFNGFLNQRIKQKPIAYIIGYKEFYGYNFFVNKNVLIPCPETELIVEEILKIIYENRNAKDRFNLIDVGTGSGCIIISILNELNKNKKNNIIGYALANDISKKAIKIAKTNALKYKLDRKINFIAGDLKNVINQKTFSPSKKTIIAANLPYIKNSDYKTLPKNVRNYEPKIALLGGIDGLDRIRRLIYKISQINKQKTAIFLIIEADPRQINKIKKILESELQNANIKMARDLNQKKRIILARF